MLCVKKFKISMGFMWLFFVVWLHSTSAFGESSTSATQQGINATGEDHNAEIDNSMEDLDTFYEYLDDSGEEDKTGKSTEIWGPDYEELFETNQQSSNIDTSDACETDTDTSTVKTKNNAVINEVQVTTSVPNVSSKWEEEKYLNLGLNPKIEISIEILHEAITARQQPTSSPMTPTNPNHESPTTATSSTASPKLSTTKVPNRGIGLLPFAIRALDKDLRPIQNKDGSQSEVDVCERWLHCPGEKMLSEMARLQDLPNCPCMYSFDIHYKDEIWDSEKKHNYRWRDASGPNDHLDIFHSGARWCIRSLIFDGNSSSMAAQKCCYDHKRQLITRGNGAGTPYFISPEVSRELHYKVDVTPWIICKGDWTRYHIRRSPNNGMQCRKNPSDNIYLKQIQKAKNYR